MASSSIDAEHFGFMGPILGRAKKVLFPDDAADNNDEVEAVAEHDAQKPSVTAAIVKNKKTKSRVRRAGRLETASSSLALVTSKALDNYSGKENNKSLSSACAVKNNRRGSAHLQKMDSLAVASTTVQKEASKSSEVFDKTQQKARQKSSTGGRRSDSSRSILEDKSLLVSSESTQQNSPARKPTGGRRSDGNRSVLEVQCCSLLTGSEPLHERRKSKVQFQNVLLPEKDSDTNQQQLNRRRGRVNHPMSSLVQSEGTYTKSKSKQILLRRSTGASSLMALPSSTQKSNTSQNQKESTRSKPKKGALNISSLVNDVGRLSLDNIVGEKPSLSPMFRSPLTIRHRSTSLSGNINSPEGILRLSTMSNSNIFRQQVLMECSPVPCLKPRKRLDKKKTPPKIIGLSSSQSPSVLGALPDQISQELVESTSPEQPTPTDMDIDTNLSEAAIVSEAETYVGRRMARTFDNKVYHGTVKRFIKAHRLWKIFYDDGDKEEMDFEELSYAIDLYDGKIKESDTTESIRKEDHKPGSAVIDVETALPIKSRPNAKAKKTYSKLPAKKIQMIEGIDEQASGEIMDAASKEATEPTRKSTRAGKQTDRLTVASWKTESNRSNHDTVEYSPNLPPVKNYDCIVKPEQSQKQVCDPCLKQDGVWSDDDVAALRGAIKDMNPTSATYWDDVSSAVGTKSSYDCRQKWFSLVATPKIKRATSKKESKPIVNFDDYNQADEETTVGRNICDEDDDDDLFDATPFRGEVLETHDEVTSKQSTVDKSKFSFGLSPCVLQQRIAKTEKSDVSNVKNRRKGYNTYIENLRKDLNRKGLKPQPHKHKPTPIMKTAVDARIFVDESEEHKVSGQLLLDGTVQINEQEESFEGDEVDDIWGDDCSEE